ncbi:hypothetical protein PTKIN_Ptkin18bG0014100 [Pterospermum kingtungense]
MMTCSLTGILAALKYCSMSYKKFSSSFAFQTQAKYLGSGTLIFFPRSLSPLVALLVEPRSLAIAAIFNKTK